MSEISERLRLRRIVMNLSQREAADTIIKIWKSHGLGWIAEMLDESKNKGYKLLNLYYGSSSYNSKQMSRLIDNVIKDCKDQGIETLPPDELDSLISCWKGKL